MYEQYFGHRREFERLPCSLMGNCISSEESSYQIKCQDISPKGIGVITSAPLSINSQVKLELNTKKMVPLTLEGKVCWCNRISSGWRVGIMFDRPLFVPIENIV
jgi:hypothetical protein